jgi:hypothetical protein
MDYYLYSAICVLGKKDRFEIILTKAFQKRLPDCLFQQISDILRQYVFAGSNQALRAVEIKYEHLRNRLTVQKTFPHRYCEREQCEALMVNLEIVKK